jgi:hypothetical protein
MVLGRSIRFDACGVEDTCGLAAMRFFEAKGESPTDLP